METIKSEMLPIGKVVENRGQVEGLAANPRSIKLDALRKLVQSIRDYPDMVSLREVLVYPCRGKYVAIGGNMRLRALRQLGYKEIPCKVIPEGTSAETLNAYMLRDNSHFGQWEITPLNMEQLGRVNLELARVEIPRVDMAQLREESVKRAPWHAAGKASEGSETVEKATDCKETERDGESRAMGEAEAVKGERERAVAGEALCDLQPRVALYSRTDFMFMASFKKSTAGIPLSEIKRDSENVELFAQQAFDFLRRGVRIADPSGWCLLTSPSRRHKDFNFATAVLERLSELSGIAFYKGYATAKNRDRIKPQFTPQFEIAERNVILYDDILTTGTTLRAMLDLLPRKNVVVLVGINNN